MSPTISIEQVPGHSEFRSLRDIPGVRHELRYASTVNFVGRDLYSPFDCAWLHREGATALERARDALQGLRPELSLLVLDALRPQRVQERLWASLEGTGLQAYLANPQRGSIHSFGMAVDVTLCDAHGGELDMATPFDDLTERSHPVLEEALLAKGEISRGGVENRRILREAMTIAGWQGITREWWHFDAADRDRIRGTFHRVL